MKYSGTAALIFLYAIASAGAVWAAEPCAPAEAPSPTSLWEAITSDAVAACINGNVEQKKQELEIDGVSADASLRKANTIGAWNALLGLLEDQSDGLGSEALNALVEQVHSRALAAWTSVSTTDMGVAASPQAYQSAWEIDFDGNLGPLVDGNGQVIEPAIELETGLATACATEGDTCPEASMQAIELIQTVRLGKEIAGFYGQPVIAGLAAEVREINNEWDRFLFQSKPMYPWSLWLTDVLNKSESSYDKKLGLRRPPDRQYFLMHPAPGFSYISEASDGQQLQPSVYVELFGINYWKKRYFTGVSVIAEYSDRANQDDVGWGALFTFANQFSFAVTANDGDVGITVGLDLANFYREQLKPQLERIKTQRPR